MAECLICGTPVKSIGAAPEIITCQNDMCIRIVENSIGLHYQAGNAASIVKTHYGLPKTN